MEIVEMNLHGKMCWLTTVHLLRHGGPVMRIASDVESGKACLVNQLAGDLEQCVRQGAEDGRPLHEIEQTIHETVLRMGHAAMKLFLSLQPDGDLGPSVTTADGSTLKRSAKPVRRPLQTVFGRFDIQAYVYSRGVNRRIELRPVDARLQLPDSYASYLFEELSQYFCVNDAFGPGRKTMDRVFRQSVSVETLERINRRVGLQAEAYLDELAAPPAKDEGELLVFTGDGKGVPLIQADAKRVPMFDGELRRGNRRMATLAGVYTVDRYDRSKEDVLAALFRERDGSSRADRPQRPEPVAKQLTARFATERDLGDGPQMISGAIEAFSWAARRVADRHRPGQPVICLMDGQPSLWDAAAAALDPELSESKIEILDLLHAAKYVWDAAKVFHSHREHQEAFARERMDRLLSGQVQSVITGLRRMATTRRLTGDKRKTIDGVCRYFENNQHRMQYDEYLRQGYPVATGVIEGACRYLVKDRMERSGMRWSLSGARSMLHVRCVHQSANHTDFYQSRIGHEQSTLHNHESNTAI
jgi:hypothetical protein